MAQNKITPVASPYSLTLYLANPQNIQC